MLTPVSSRFSRMADFIGDGPRRRGSIEGWILRRPYLNESITDLGIIFPYEATMPNSPSMLGIKLNFRMASKAAFATSPWPKNTSLRPKSKAMK